ncbi:MAG: Ig-like domain-containing protein [Ruminococcus sp.]|nr:Ig-like domain-containing protein [Ruminococcus sp.]
MDNSNNHNSEKPRKKVTKKILRRRQLCALAVIALIVLILVILIANACTDKTTKPKKEDSTTSSTTTTTTTTETEPITEPPTTTAIPVPTADPDLSAQVQLDKTTINVTVGGSSDYALITNYPEGSTADNEVWKSDNENIATVDIYGNVTGVNAGTCLVTLSFSNHPEISIPIQVNVTDPSATPLTPDVNQQDLTPDVPQNTPDIQNNQNNQGYQDSQGFQDTQNYYQNNQAQQDNQDSSQEFPEVSNVMPET